MVLQVDKYKDLRIAFSDDLHEACMQRDPTNEHLIVIPRPEIDKQLYTAGEFEIYLKLFDLICRNNNFTRKETIHFTAISD